MQCLLVILHHFVRLASVAVGLNQQLREVLSLLEMALSHVLPQLLLFGCYLIQHLAQQLHCLFILLRHGETHCLVKVNFGLLSYGKQVHLITHLLDYCYLEQTLTVAFKFVQTFSL